MFSKYCAEKQRCKRGVLKRGEVKMSISYKETKKNTRLGDFILLNDMDSEEEYKEEIF